MRICWIARNTRKYDNWNVQAFTALKMIRSQSTEHSESGDDSVVREFRANGLSMNTTEVEAKLDEGNIQEAESSLREGLSLNFEVGF